MAEDGRAFLDTNVLVYLFDTRDEVKHERAKALLREIPSRSQVVSAQVLGEFYWTVTRKLATPMSQEDAEAAVDRFARLTVVAVDGDLVRSAIELSRRASIAYWDALIVKAAGSALCDRILTEDLNDGQTIDGVLVEDPFRDVSGREH